MGSLRIEPDQAHHPAGAEDRHERLRRHHISTLWLPIIVIIAGVWLATSPFTFGYVEGAAGPPRAAEVVQARDLPSPEARGMWMTWSDLVSGLALVVLGALSLQPNRVLPRWGAAAVGVWLLFAPLVLWAPTPAAYATDTAIGFLVIAATILIPPMPGMALIMQPGPEVPPGWSYNPSSWYQRSPMIALSLAGFFLSRYLGAFQLGYLDWAADPFFGRGTVEILTSEVSRGFPVSDAALGASAISLEALMGFMGGTSRWRTMPWMVTFFGILVVPLGVAHVVLVILQPVAVGTWCSFCLATALLMLAMIPLAVDEVVAMTQFVLRRHAAGKGLWEVFWKGDTDEGEATDHRSPRYPAPLSTLVGAGLWGVRVPGTLGALSLLGVWEMAAPAVLGLEGAAADSAHLTGALVVVIAVVATAEVARAFRWLAVPAGVWLLTSTWVLPHPPTARWVTTGVGLAVVLLSLYKGRIRERYGHAQRWIV